MEYIYRGEVLIESDKFMDVAEAAHTLGINGLKDFLPDPPKRRKVSPADSSTTATTAAGVSSSGKDEQSKPNSENVNKSPSPQPLPQPNTARKPDQTEVMGLASHTNTHPHNTKV